VKPACLILHYRQKYQSKILIEGSGSKAEKRKFQDVWKSETLWLIIYDYSRDVMSCDVFQKAGPDIAGKTDFVIGKKKFKRESLVYHNKSQKHEKCFNMASAKAHSSTYTSSSSKPSSSLILQSFEKQSEKNEIRFIIKLPLLLPKK
jgi:hypothetical protein